MKVEKYRVIWDDGFPPTHYDSAEEAWQAIYDCPSCWGKVESYITEEEAK